MQITRPSDCGKAPGIAIVGKFAAKWAAGEATAVAEWLTDDASWSLIGAGTHSGPEAAEQVIPRRMGFSHALRFASTSKTAKIAEVRSYCIETGSDEARSA